MANDYVVELQVELEEPFDSPDSGLFRSRKVTLRIDGEALQKLISAIAIARRPPLWYGENPTPDCPECNHPMHLLTNDIWECRNEACPTNKGEGNNILNTQRRLIL